MVANRENIDCDEYLKIRIENKKNKYIDSKLTDLENEFYLYNI